ncbi:MAG: CoA transferase [Chloroflexi bacterium]|nr:CoA transferase [Chloroflexota bacterium]
MIKLPLEGVRVIDICVVWAGPFATRMLGDLGAEVIRVETLRHFPALTRGQTLFPPPALYNMFPNNDPGEKHWNRGAMFNGHGRNKKSCVIDLEHPKGKEVFRRLIQVSDVFIENNSAATMENLGLTYETMSSWNPRLIGVNNPAFGLTGPYKYYRGFGDLVEAAVGHHWVRGYPDDDHPYHNTSVFHMDATGGGSGALAIMAALHYRERTGKGQHIDMAGAESAMPQLAQPIMDYIMNGRVQRTLGNRDPVAAPQGVYRCRGEDRWAVISVTSDEEWAGLCRALGRPELVADPRYATLLARRQHHDELDALIEAWTLQYDHYAVMHILQREGVPAGPVMDGGDANHDPQLVSRGFFDVAHHPQAGTHLYPGALWKYSRTPITLRYPAPCLGEHNDYVFRELLGLEAEDIAALEQKQIIGGDTYVEYKKG